ncbi:hypothetical protein HUU53_04235, partial [Candidatus Micrarchaeota archaeon]|nr:hypothetical protein [Candidatus Micrarchaeota archaeon]
MGAVSNWLLVLVLASSFSFAITYVNSIGNPGFENFICQGTLNCENFGDEETCNLYAEYSCFFEEGRCLTGGDPDCGSYGIPDAETCQALQCSWDSDFWVPAISGCSGCSVWPSDAGTKNSGVYSAITNSSGVSSNGYVQIYQSLPYSPLALNVSNFTNANSRLTAYGLWRKAASGGNDTLVFQINSTKSKAINYVWGATGLSNVSGVVCNYEMGSLPGTWTAFLNTNFYRDWVNCPGFTFDDQLKNLSLYSNGVSTPVGQDFNWDDLLLNHSDKAKPPVFVENIA